MKNKNDFLFFRGCVRVWSRFCVHHSLQCLMGGSPSRVPKEDFYPDRTVTVDELLSALSTGDIVLFRGNGTSAWWIRLWEMCAYSHVGMVHVRTFEGHSEPTVCLWESVGHIDNLVCLLHGRQKTGPRLVSLRDKLNTYIAGSGGWRETKICVIKLHPQPMEAGQHLDRNLTAFEEQICGRTNYPNAEEMVAGALWQLPMGAPISPAPTLHSMDRWAPQPRTDYNCIQLIATTLIRMGAYASTLNTDRITLNSFLDGSITEQDRYLAVLDQVNYHWTVKPSPPPPSMEIFQVV